MLKTTAAQLADYFLGRKVCFTARLDLTPLTPFARKVLTALAHLPYGQTTTYSQLAKRIGAPAGARAVGSCLARNPLPLIIPCHRVLLCSGGLGGFSAPQGPPLKRRLLMLENIEL
ncbi:MAG: methylated-DNA--[protein]-cysteine S-methyltransferase [Phycisphaerae bacterium]|nr:methylated-DNA--[protein]-cysteine S-methyltransferase [Phycisphaerae bacterium]